MQDVPAPGRDVGLLQCWCCPGLCRAKRLFYPSRAAVARRHVHVPAVDEQQIMSNGAMEFTLLLKGHDRGVPVLIGDAMQAKARSYSTHLHLLNVITERGQGRSKFSSAHLVSTGTPPAAVGPQAHCARTAERQLRK